MLPLYRDYGFVLFGENLYLLLIVYFLDFFLDWSDDRQIILRMYDTDTILTTVKGLSMDFIPEINVYSSSLFGSFTYSGVSEIFFLSKVYWLD